MHRIRTILILAPLLLIAATCVTDVRQRGPAGPWVGEIINYSDETIGPVVVRSSINDSTGQRVARPLTGTCPSLLDAGETGAFEVFAPQTTKPNDDALSLTITSVINDIEAKPEITFSDDGLTVRLVETIQNDSLAIVELHNGSRIRYDELVVCGTLRTSDGQLVEVGNTKLYPPALEPGATRTLPVVFNSMPEGEFEFFASGENARCCQSISLNGDQFTPAVQKVVRYADGDFLIATGDVANPTSLDLTNIQIAAHASSSWTDRVTPSAFRTDGCGGALPAGGSIPVFLSIPLRASAPAVTAISETIVATIPERPPFPLTVDDVNAGPAFPTPDGQLEERVVTAFIRNPVDSWVDVLGVCLILRDEDGRIVGMREVNPGGHLAPGQVREFSWPVAQLAASASADVIAYAVLRDGPVIINPP